MDEQKKEYERLRKKLRDALQEKKQLEAKWDALEQEIYDKETAYLSQKPSSRMGNILMGFQGFNKNSSAQQILSDHSHSSHAHTLDDNDRIFSLSSALFVKQLQGSAPGSGAQEDE
ncbi:chromatin modification-related protein EAF6 [Kluyveromyces marxianus]|uniref:Chromatin modification-related protein EAF6 n=2 Tax=Kluyveromyces marxianus TaxID=4911 RepID=W0TFY9_KLUMD|nr:chromatin modification-related protein EAF6 [Kluyveromyces marxianus DMKU3-1042]QGN18110.1 chromatin modification-related protein EAF6 [Kluyveromyces marxianus]BAO41973.1 chromatin modification-related protein EAF6 [Kluyveromyces marxianus DMKU3-1042]